MLTVLGAVNAIDHHLHMPEISLDAHVRQCQISLGTELSLKTAIYLLIIRDTHPSQS